MDRNWISLQKEGYENYSVSDAGDVRRDCTDRIVKPFRNGNGYLQVGLYKGGVRKKFGVNRLVASAFLAEPKESHFNSILHKDGNKDNCAASNLVWRPRWFVVKFHQEMALWDNNVPFRMVVDETSGREYSTVRDVVVAHGILYSDLINGIHNHESPLFAEGRIFKYR